MTAVLKLLTIFLFCSRCFASSIYTQENLQHGHQNVIKKPASLLKTTTKVMALTGLHFKHLKCLCYYTYSLSNLL